MALDSCTGPDSAKKRALVNGTHANQLFENGSFVMAAQYYALSNFSFESVALKFIQKRQIKSLEEYLNRVLNVYKASKDQGNDQNKVQRMVICTWLVELKLKTLNEIRASKFDAGFTDDIDEFEQKALMHETILKGIESNFQDFLVKN